MLISNIGTRPVELPPFFVLICQISVNAPGISKNCTVSAVVATGQATGAHNVLASNSNSRFADVRSGSNPEWEVDSTSDKITQVSQ